MQQLFPLLEETILLGVETAPDADDPAPPFVDVAWPRPTVEPPPPPPPPPTLPRDVAETFLAFVNATPELADESAAAATPVCKFTAK